VFQKKPDIVIRSTPVEFGSQGWQVKFDAAARVAEANADAISFDSEGFQIFGNNDKKIAIDGVII